MYLNRLFKLVCCVSLLSSSACIHKANGQIMTSNGGTLYIANGGILFSNGGVNVTNNSLFENQGTFTVTKNSTFPEAGNFSINTLSDVSGNGMYRVEQDWINNGNFAGDNSTTELYGNTEQFIRSDIGNTTTFNNLVLTGNGAGADKRKTLQNADAGVGTNGSLALNDRELATETRTFFVLNPALGAVTNQTVPGNEGFVSSLAGGYFSRVTGSNNPYLYPTGSSLGTQRYRPLEILPTAGGNPVYAARLNNSSATPDGFPLTSTDDKICTLNDLYYHSIIRSAGNSPADLRFFYLPATDGNWNHTARWTNPTARWNDMGPGTNGNAGGFSTLTQNAWNFPDNNHPYVLSTPRPDAPSITCPIICENSIDNVFTATGSNTGYQWTFPAQGNLIQGQGTGSVTASWTTGTGYVSVFAPGVNGGCDSRPDSCLPMVYEVPDAAFLTLNDGTADNLISFIDQSSSGNSWLWNFGDGNTSNLNSPFHGYSTPGTYTVSLTVSNPGGCSDIATSLATILNREIFIPNTFTPNQNNINEVWRPILLNAEKYELRIFNRWGEEIFRTTDPNYGWDGTYQGKICPLGVYVYRISAKLSGQFEKVYTGNVNLLR